MRSPLRFYFDFISPYAYLAWTQLPRLGCAIEPVPVLFAAMLDAHGTTGPAEVPARRRYLVKDVARKAHRLGAPFALPFAHPFNPLLALRVASLPMTDANQTAVIDSLYRAAWVERRDVTQPAVVAQVLADAGLDASLVERAGDAKATVRSQTDEAIARGVFGVPTMIIDDEMFWGTDSLPDVEHYLAGHDPVAPELVAQWESLPAAATRPRSS